MVKGMDEVEKYDVIVRTWEAREIDTPNRGVVVEEDESGDLLIQVLEGGEQFDAFSFVTVNPAHYENAGHTAPIQKACAFSEVRLPRHDNGSEKIRDHIIGIEVERCMEELVRRIPSMFDEEEWGRHTWQPTDELYFNKSRDEEENTLHLEVRAADVPEGGL